MRGLLGVTWWLSCAATACDGSNVVGRITLDATVDNGPVSDAPMEAAVDVAEDALPDFVPPRPDIVTDLPMDVAPDMTCVSPDGGALLDVATDLAPDAGPSAPVVQLETSHASGFTCVTHVNGEARCVGDNNLGQLGDGTAMNRARPVLVMGLVSARQVVAGGAFACGLLGNRTVRCWGANTVGQLGDGMLGMDHRTALPVSNLTTAIQLAAGTQHACALLDGGAVQCWGSNRQGQLGVGAVTPETQATPTMVTGLTGVRQIDLGGNFSCALMGTGEVRCWGQNTLGQLGDGTPSAMPRTLPTAVRNVACAVKVTAGDNHACVLFGSGGAQCWGVGTLGQLGNGAMTGISPPVPVLGLDGAVDLSAGGQHTCAVIRDGSVRCWGANTAGQLGNNTMTSSSSPVVVQGITDAAFVAAGAQHTCAVLRGGGVRCWGSNTAGQLGDGSNTARATPVAMMF